MNKDLLLNKLEELQEAFRTDVDKHEEYNLLTDTIELINNQREEIDGIIDDFSHEEYYYQEEISILEDKIYDLQEELRHK